MSKYATGPADPYIHPDHRILRNRLNITDSSELERLEATLVVMRTYELSLEPILGNFDLAHIRQIHRRLFGDIYSWAGEIRTVDISKGESRFAHHAQIARYAPQISRALAQENTLKDLSPEKFSERAGHYLGELNVLHPFREGNGRTLREFIGQIARNAGYIIDWSRVDRESNIRASIQAYHGDSSGLARLILDNLRAYDR